MEAAVNGSRIRATRARGSTHVRRRDLLRGALATLGMPSVLASTGTVASQQSTGLRVESAPKRFRVEFGKDRITDLYERIDRMVWPEIGFDTGWSTGTNDKELRELARYWRRDFDWFRTQEEVNRLPHYTLAIEGENIHFVWHRAKEPRQKFPLLLLHGWPSSFLEFSQAAPLLSAGSEGRAGFDLVIPSLPGFVFSDAPRTAGLYPGQIADRLHLLMRALGYDRFGVQGYDWGAIIANRLGRSHASAVVGLHLPSPPWRAPTNREPTAEEKAYIARRELFSRTGTAYSWIQRTKPQSLGYALQDSPVGLLAWILEKYWAWADHRGHLWDVISRDHVLTTTTLYWLTNHVLSAARIYFEHENAPPSDQLVTVPTWFQWVPGDPFSSAPRSLWNPSTGYTNIVKISELPRGGHFPAIEQPNLWAADVLAFFSSL